MSRGAFLFDIGCIVSLVSGHRLSHRDLNIEGQTKVSHYHELVWHTIVLSSTILWKSDWRTKVLCGDEFIAMAHSVRLVDIRLYCCVNIGKIGMGLIYWWWGCVFRFRGDALILHGYKSWAKLVFHSNGWCTLECSRFCVSCWFSLYGWFYCCYSFS